MSVERFKYLPASSYLSRLGFYFVVVGVASIGGSYFTRMNNYWVYASVGDALIATAFSLGLRSSPSR